MFTIKKSILRLSCILVVLFLASCDNDTHSNDHNDSYANDDETVEVGGIIGEGETIDESSPAFELLERANAEINGLDGLIIEFSTETTTPILGVEQEILMEMTMSGTMEAVASGDSFEASTEIEQDFMGLLTTFTAYFKDDVLYVDLREDHDIGMKSEVEPFNAFALINIRTDFSENDILEQSVDVTDDEITLTFSLDEAALLEVVNGQLNIGELIADYLGDFTYTMVVVIDRNHIIQSIEVEIDFVYELDEREADMSMNSVVEVTPNSSIIIEFPEGLDEFFLGETTIPPW